MPNRFGARVCIFARSFFYFLGAVRQHSDRYHTVLHPIVVAIDQAENLPSGDQKASFSASAPLGNSSVRFLLPRLSSGQRKGGPAPDAATARPSDRNRSLPERSTSIIVSDAEISLTSVIEEMQKFNKLAMCAQLTLAKSRSPLGVT